MEPTRYSKLTPEQLSRGALYLGCLQGLCYLLLVAGLIYGVIRFEKWRAHNLAEELRNVR